MSVAIVVGGASGLGEAIAHRLKEMGHHVVVADMDADGATRVATDVGGTAVTVDIRHSDEVACWASIAQARPRAHWSGAEHALPEPPSVHVPALDPA